MKFQIIVVEYNQPHISPPYGAMYIARSLMDEGHEVRIEVSSNWNNIGYQELCSRIEKYSPDAIGFSATICLGYAYVKKASQIIRQRFPDLKILVGGGLTSAAGVLLTNTDVDIAVIGEGEITIKELAERIENKWNYDDVKGIAYKKGDRVLQSPRRLPVANIDHLGYPAFDLVPMGKYLKNIHAILKAFPSYRKWDKRFFEPHYNTRMFRVPTARGCISKCSFCYRHMKGIRHFSLDYLFDYIEFIMDKYNTNQFSFGDECFSSSKKWTLKFIKSLKKRKLNIMFQIIGMRVDTVDKEILHELKESGCWMIEYGFESGSQKMLNVMDKGVSVNDNINVAQWTKEAGIYTSPAFVIGMPGETAETINETIEFLKKIKYDYFQYTYAFPVPGTPLYEYALLKGLITDEDKYLEGICNVAPNNFIESNMFVNFTNEDRATVMKWPKMMEKALRSNAEYLSQFYFSKLRNVYNYIKKDGFVDYIANFAKRKINFYKIKMENSCKNKHRVSPKLSNMDRRETIIPPEGEKLRVTNMKLKKLANTLLS